MGSKLFDSRKEIELTENEIRLLNELRENIIKMQYSPVKSCSQILQNAAYVNVLNLIDCYMQGKWIYE